MLRITIPFKELTPATGHSYQFDELKLTKNNMTDILTYSKVPTTLLNIDAKFGTHTAVDVLNTLESPTIDALVDEETSQVQILDPRSTFMSDAQFESLVSQIPFAASEEKSRGFQRSVRFDLPTTDSDSFLGDLFSRHISLERLPQGGVFFNMGLLRLACTNGMRVADSQFSHIIRNGQPEESLLNNIVSDQSAFDLDTYFRNIFTDGNGEFFPVSVADYFAMKDTITRLTDPDTSDLYFPTDSINFHYESQGIDLHKINRSLLNKLPAGMTYYQAFNILTNASKQIADPTLEDQIKIGAFAKPSRLQSLKQTELQYHGQPEFTAQQISALMGDRPLVTL